MLGIFDTICFADGSRVDNLGSGAGVFIEDLNIRNSYSLGQFVTVPQAEAFAIAMCSSSLSQSKVTNKNIGICSDSKSVLQSLISPKIDSKLVFECKKNLCLLAETNTVKLLWVPGHRGIEGNEEADSLARQGSETPFLGPEPALGIAYSRVKGACYKWQVQEQEVRFNSFPSYRETKVFLNSVKREVYIKVLKLSREKTSKVVAFITGHCRLKKHLRRIGVTQEIRCSLCQEGEESPEHLMKECEALAALRQKIFGSHELKGKILDQVPIPVLLRFLESTGLEL